MRKSLFVALFAIVACAGKAPPHPDAALLMNVPFGGACTVVSNMSTECTSHVCSNTFDQAGTPLCSQQCTVLGGTDPSCPSGSKGTFCNMKGYCKP